MRYFVMVMIFLQWWAGPVHGQNDHGITSSTGEQRARDHDAHLPYVTSGCLHLLPVSSLIVATEACDAYVVTGPAGKLELAFARQVTIALTIPDVTGTHWIAIDESTSAARAGYTRPVFGGRYLLQQSATQPAPIDGVLVVTMLEVTDPGGGNVPGFRGKPRRSRVSLTCFRKAAFRRKGPRVSSAPRNRLSSTLSSGTSENS